MVQDLEALAPSVIICVAFLVGVIALLKHEMAPKRANQEDSLLREEDAAREEQTPTEL